MNDWTLLKISRAVLLAVALLVIQLGCIALPTISPTQTTQAIQAEQTENRLISTDHTFETLEAGAIVDVVLGIQFVGRRETSAIIASGLSEPFSFKGGIYPGLGGSCGTKIQTSCFIVLTFAPTQPGSFASTLKLEYGGKAALIIHLSGMAKSTQTLEKSQGSSNTSPIQVLHQSSEFEKTVINLDALKLLSDQSDIESIYLRYR